MSDLRDAVIKLAYRKPELRDELLPLLKTANRGRAEAAEMAEGWWTQEIGRAVRKTPRIRDVEIKNFRSRRNQFEFTARIELDMTTEEAAAWLESESKVKVPSKRGEEITKWDFEDYLDVEVGREYFQMVSTVGDRVTVIWEFEDHGGY